MSRRLAFLGMLIVRNHDNRFLEFLIESFHNVRISSADFLSRSPVGSSATRITGSVTTARRNCNRLLLSAGKLFWIVSHSIAKPNNIQCRASTCFSFGFGKFCKKKRQFNIFKCGKNRIKL